MKKLAIFFMSGAVLAFGSCSDLEQIDQEQGSITAIMEGSDTRTSVTDEGAFTWSEGDKIWLQTTNGSIVGTLSDGEGTPNANFSYGAIIGGTLTGKAIYPYNAGHTADDDAVAVVLPASYELGSSLNNTNAAMYGVNSNGTIKFNHLAGVMRFSFKNVPAGVDRFAITMDKKINGTFEANLAAAYPVLETIETDVEGEKTVELNFDVLAETSDINLYVPLPLGTYTTLGLELFKGETSVWTYSNTVTNTVNRKSLKLMPTVTLGGSIGGEIEGVEVPNNQIWYTASEKVEPYNLRGINQELVIESHTYDPTTQKGVITFTGRIEEIPDDFFFGKSAVTSVSLPNIVIIGARAFEECHLTSLTVPKTVCMIGADAFRSTSLREINILSEQLVDHATQDAFNTAVLEKITGPLASADGRFLINKGMLVTTALSGVSEMIIPQTVTTIGCDCVGNELQKVTIPSSVKVFNACCFSNNPVLTEVIIASESMEGNSELINPFWNCPKLTKFTGPLATNDGRFLVQDNTLIAIASYGLSELQIPEGVEIIGNYSALGLKIKDITLPSTLTYIYNLGGENLETLTCLAHVPPRGNFLTVGREYKIYVPAEFLEEYKSEWSMYADCIFPIPPINLSGSTTANSYIVSAAGLYKFSTVKGNSSESVGAVASAEVLWETFGTDVTPNIGDLVKNAVYSDGYITFKTAETFKEGNAVIAAKNSAGKILWSWHIWLTDAPKEHAYGSYGFMMDRNLGALTSEVAEYNTAGLLYQWGRKDPFLGAKSMRDNRAKQQESSATWPSPVVSSSTTGTIEYATENPMTFITYNANNRDWQYSTDTSSDFTRWASNKTEYDPCPAGWRVPDGGPDGIWAKSNYPYNGSWFYSYHTQGKYIDDKETGYPAAPYLIGYTGELYDPEEAAGWWGHYWSCTTTETGYGYTDPYVLEFFYPGNVHDEASSRDKAAGYSVRCQKEQ
jgi:hypothetical protein